MRDKRKLTVTEMFCGGSDPTVPHFRSKLGQQVMAADLNEIAIRLQEALRVLNVRECPACKKLQHQCKNLAGICTECWAWNADLAEAFDFSSLTDLEIARHWEKLESFLGGFRATGRAVDAYKQAGPPEFAMAAGIEATLGTERIARALWQGIHRERAGFYSWNSMRWDRELGIVPATGRHPKLGEYQEWQAFWTAAPRKGKCFVRITDEMKQAA